MANFSSMPLSLVDSRLPETLRSKRRRLASTPATPSPLPSTVDELLNYLGMKFEPSPPLPLKVTGFNFLKSIDLSTVGVSLEGIPFIFGWSLVKFSPSRVETGDEPGWEIESEWDGDKGDDKMDLDVEKAISVYVLDCRPSQTWSATGWDEDLNIPGLDLNDSLTESAPDLQTGPDPVLDEVSSESPITTDPNPFHSSSQKRVKLPAGRPNPPSTKLSLKSHEPASRTHKESTPRPTRKSSRLAFQTRPRPHKQSSTLINVSDTSSESTASSEDWHITEPPSIPKTTTTPSPQSAPKPKPALKRKGVTKPSSTQGQVRKDPTPPPSKKAKKSTTSASQLNKFLQRSVKREDCEG